MGITQMDERQLAINAIQLMVDAETAAWNRLDADALVALFHPDMVWVWPPDAASHDPESWVMPMGRFDASRWISACGGKNGFLVDARNGQVLNENFVLRAIEGLHHLLHFLALRSSPFLPVDDRDSIGSIASGDNLVTGIRCNANYCRQSDHP